MNTQNSSFLGSRFSSLLLGILVSAVISFAPLLAKTDEKKHHDHDHKTKKHGERREHKAHSHGHAEMKIVISEKEVSIDFEIPTEDAFGFEHKPKTKEELAKVEGVKKAFESNTGILGFDGAAKCTLKKAKVESDYDDNGHSDFEASYTFVCEDPKKIKNIRLSLFESFKSLSEINVQGLNGEVAIAQTLNQKSAVLKLN